MTRKIPLTLLIISLLGCNEFNAGNSVKSSSGLSIIENNNRLRDLSTEDLNGFEWMNKPEDFSISGSDLKIVAKKGTDFFNNPEDSSVVYSAPLLYEKMSGDFIATALVEPDFTSLWNAAALMVYVDSLNWIKFAFENSDATGKSIVTVVTRNVSDDANGPILTDADSIWLRIIRKGSIYAMHWSGDGRAFKMARLSSLPSNGIVKIGLEAQCPVGRSAEHTFRYFSLEPKTVNDLRKGE